MDSQVENQENLEEQITVVIIDDDELVCAGIEASLSRACPNKKKPFKYNKILTN